MRRSPRSPSKPQRRPGNPKSETSVDPGFKRLERQFAKFRRNNPARTRVPADLRRAVVAAIGRGVTPDQLRRSCGVSWNQTQQWQKNDGAGLARPRPKEEGVRVFPVIDSLPEQEGEPTEPDRERQIEFRLDGWSICIRHVDL